MGLLLPQFPEKRLDFLFRTMGEINHRHVINRNLCQLRLCAVRKNYGAEHGLMHDYLLNRLCQPFPVACALALKVKSCGIAAQISGRIPSHQIRQRYPGQ